MSTLTGILIGLVLLVLNGLFVAAEIGLLAAKPVRIMERAEQGDRRAVTAQRLLGELSITFSGAQLGITMTSLGLGAIAEPAVAHLIEGWLVSTPIPESAHKGIGFAIGMSIVVFLHMVVGEMAPKNLALARAEDVSLRLARPFRWFVAILRPLILVLNGTANALIKLFGVEPSGEHSMVHTPDELAMALRESSREGTVESQDLRMLMAALRLADIDAEAAMTARVDLEALADHMPAEAVIQRARATGYTRFPVFHDDVDDVVGLVHVKDVLIRTPEELIGVTVGDLQRPIPAVPENRDLQQLLTDMRADRSHAVLVVDEYGGTAGLLTLEDVVEELVGEIDDEFDSSRSLRRRTGDGVWLVDGTLRRDELARLCGLRLEADETETINGWLVEELGRLVQRGDVVTSGGWSLKVVGLQGMRAGRVEVTAPPPSVDDLES